jgi:hypothetical protein
LCTNVAMTSRFHITRLFADCREFHRSALGFTMTRAVDPSVNNIC